MRCRARRLLAFCSPAWGRAGCACWAFCLAIAGCVPLGGVDDYSGVDPQPFESAEPRFPFGSTPALGAAGRRGRGDAGAVEGRRASADAGAVGVAAPPVDAAAGGPARCDGPGEALSPAGDACYRAGQDPVAWDAARDACAAWGGDLARVDSELQLAALVALAASDSWIGLNDAAVEGEMRWVDGSLPAGEVPWAADQPDDFGGNEDCVELLADGRGYNDRPCGDPRAFLCQR